jgi:hypothetical protein
MRALIQLNLSFDTFRVHFHFISDESVPHGLAIADSEKSVRKSGENKKPNEHKPLRPLLWLGYYNVWHIYARRKNNFPTLFIVWFITFLIKNIIYRYIHIQDFFFYIHVSLRLHCITYDTLIHTYTVDWLTWINIILFS